MFIERLRSETKSIHQALEKAMIPGIRNAKTPEAYGAILKTFYGYFKAIENLLDKQLTDKIVPAYDQRRKAHIIIEDLKAINQNGALPPLATELPEISNAYQALGAMYVLEGSTLGGQVITKMLMQNLNLTDSAWIRFFSGYGDDTQKMWGSFIGVLNQYSQDETRHDEMIEAAINTFAQFKTWIEKNQAS
jgi:heme oxygenase (biliverdin-IX-beta and delta-forming)